MGNCAYLDHNGKCSPQCLSAAIACRTARSRRRREFAGLFVLSMAIVGGLAWIALHV